MNLENEVVTYKTPSGEHIRLQASSYETRDANSDAGAGWIAQAHVWEDVWENGESTTLITPFWPHGSHRFSSPEVANAAALHGAARWVDEGRPPVPLAGA